MSSLDIDHVLISSLKRECFCLWPQLSPLATVANKHFTEERERAAFLQLLLDQFSLLTPPPHTCTCVGISLGPAMVSHSAFSSLMCDFKCPGPLMMIILIGNIQAIYTGALSLLTKRMCCFSSSLLLYFVILFFLFTCFNTVFLSSLATYVSAETTLNLFSTIYPYLTRCLDYGKCLVNPRWVKQINK